MHMSFTGERYVPELRGQIYYEHFHRYAMVLELAREKDVLDIACGEGYGTAALALVARSAVGVDRDAESVRHAAARYMAMNVGFRTGDCTQIPAGDASFDLAVSFETIEHLNEQERMLGELKRVLRPNGVLVISSPNKLVYSDGRSFQNPFHERELYFHEFRDMLRSFFPKVRMFGQRVFAASAVHPLRGAADETRWLGPSTIAEGTLGALPDPEYFVAICASAESDDLPDLCSVYLDPRDELLADIRAGGIASSINGEHAALGASARAGVLTSGHQPPDDESSRRIAAMETELAGAERDLAARVAQVKSVEDHAVGLEALLRAEQGKTSELVARVESLADELAHEREMASMLETERRRESEALAARIAVMEQERDEAQRVAAERGLESESLTARIEEVARERDEARRLETERERVRGSLAARVAELEHAAQQADERRVTLERAREAIAAEREQITGTVQHLQRELSELRQERGRTERHAAALGLERDSLREGLNEQQRRQDDEIRALEAASDRAREHADRELAAMREENRQLTARVAELSDAAAQQAAERDEISAALVQNRNWLHVSEEARRELDRLVAQLKLERLNYDELALRTHQAETLLSEVLGSTSWRLTLPARRFMGVIRGRGKE